MLVIYQIPLQNSHICRYPHRYNTTIVKNLHLHLLKKVMIFFQIQDDTADLHGISQQMVSKLCKNVAIALAKIACRYISMPTTLLEEECIMREFRSIAGFPSIIGAIDCTHIKIKRVGGDASEAYVNRKGYFSLNVQVSFILYLFCDQLVPNFSYI